MTGQDVFNIAMSLMDEYLETGQIDPTSTATFQVNAPKLLNLLQAELVDDNERKRHEITKLVTTNAGGYEEYTMPTDFHDARQVITIETDGVYQNATEMKWEDNVLLVPDEFTGLIRVVYRPVPALLTALTDPITIDPITARTTLAYGLASRLLTNENQNISNYFQQLYEAEKNKPKRRNVAFGEPIKDYYDTNLNY